MMKLTKEESLEALKRLKEIEVYGDDVILLKFASDISLIEQLINEHFELVKENELLKRENIEIEHDNELNFNELSYLKERHRKLLDSSIILANDNKRLEKENDHFEQENLLLKRENKALADDNYQKCELNEKLSKEVEKLKKNLDTTCKFYDDLLKKYESLKENPPLKFDELHEGMWVWDNVLKRYMKIYDISYSEESFNVNGEWCLDDLYLEEFEFKENRFYIREVK